MISDRAIPTHTAPRPDNQDPALFGQTPWQTVGPFFHYGLPWKGGADLVGDTDIGARTDLFPEEHDVLNRAVARGLAKGTIVEIVGTVRDGEGVPVPDAMIEIWGADAAGRYSGPAHVRGETPAEPGFSGFGRAAVSAEGSYRFITLRPGRVPVRAGGAVQAPHIAVGVFGRGLLKRLCTRLYFADAEENAEDPVLALVPEARRRTLVAPRTGDAPPTYRFDIVLSGANETVFFDL